MMGTPTNETYPNVEQMKFYQEFAKKIYTEN